ncbi:hypothetical protein YC2023_033162 [Brassica napus]
MESRTYELEGDVSPTTPPHTGPERPGKESRTQGGGKRSFTEEISRQRNNLESFRYHRRLYQGQGTFQFAPEVDMTPPTRGRGRPRKTGPTREEVEEDPSEDSEWEEEPASSTGSGRAAGSKPEGEQKSPVRSG